MAAPVVASYSTAHNINTTGTITCNKPSGTVEGELLIAYVLAAGWSGYPTISTPSGWTKESERTGDYYYNGTTPNAHGAVYSRVCGASEPATYTWVNAIATGTYSNVLLLRITGAAPSAPVDAVANVNTTSGTTYNFPSVTTTGPDRLICLFGGVTNNPTASEYPLVAPAGFTRQAYINDIAEFVNLGSASKAQASAGASGAFTVLYNDAEQLAQGFTVAIRPAASALSLSGAIAAAGASGAAVGVLRPVTGVLASIGAGVADARALRPVGGEAAGAAMAQGAAGGGPGLLSAIASGLGIAQAEVLKFSPLTGVGAGDGAATCSLAGGSIWTPRAPASTPWGATVPGSGEWMRLSTAAGSWS